MRTTQENEIDYPLPSWESKPQVFERVWEVEVVDVLRLKSLSLQVAGFPDLRNT